MQVGTYVDGRTLNYDEAAGAFDVGGSPVTFQDVRAYDEAGQLSWLSEEINQWVQALPTGLAASVEQEAAVAVQASTEPKRGRLFGFRSGQLWKKTVASAYYVMCGLIALGVFASVRPYATEARDFVLDILSYLILVLALVSPALLLSDFGYRDKLPLFKRRSAKLSALGLVIVFVLLSVTSAFAASQHSEPYKVAAAQEAAALQKKEDAERAAAAAAQRSADASAAAEAAKLADAQKSAEASKAANAVQLAQAQKSAEASKAAEAKALTDAASSQKAAADAAARSATKTAVLAFEQDVYAAERPATSAIKACQKLMTAFGKGRTSIYAVYGAAKDAQSACDSAQSAYWDLDVPSGLPADVEGLLDEAKSSMSTTYMVKAQAFGALMTFLDDQKPSDLQEFKDKSRQADSLTLSAVAKLFEAKEKLGIPLTAPGK